jgi:hypothetical protein
MIRAVVVGDARAAAVPRTTCGAYTAAAIRSAATDRAHCRHRLLHICAIVQFAIIAIAIIIVVAGVIVVAKTIAAVKRVMNE